MGRLIGITGTPGTGKKSIAPMVASALGLHSLSLPSPPRLSRESERVTEVDTAQARRNMSAHPPGDAVVYGHLLPYILPRKLVWKVVVLRCDPAVLKGRLSDRGYPAGKTRENVEAELIGLIADDSYRAFGGGSTFEFDTTASTPGSAAEAIVGFLRGWKTHPRRYDWMVNYRSPGALTSLLGADVRD